MFPEPNLEDFLDEVLRIARNQAQEATDAVLIHGGYYPSGVPLETPVRPSLGD